MRPTTLFLLFVAGCGGAPSRTFNGGGGGDGGATDMAFSFGGDDGGKKPGMVCNPSDPPSCANDSIVETCRADGSGYDNTACPDGSTCKGGMCTCMPGALDCMGLQVVKCGNDGMFHPDHTCGAGTNCQNGACSDPRCADESMSTNPKALPTLGWPRFRHDNRNSGSTPAVVADNPKLKWKTTIGGTSLDQQGGLASGPVVNQDDIVFIGAGDLDGAGGSYYSLDATGKKLYTFSARRMWGLSTPAVRADGTSYFSTTNSELFAVDPKGNQAWQYRTGSQADSDPVITKDGNVIYSSDDGSVYCLDPNGNVLWKTAIGGPGEVDGGVAETCDGKIIVGGMNGWFALDAKTGNTLWKVQATGARGALLSSPLVTADGNTFGFDSGGQGVAIDPMGKVLWQRQVGPQGAGSSAALSGGVIYVVLNDGALHAIDPATGAEKWSKPTNNNPHVYLNAGPVADGKGRIYFNSSDGNVYAFDATGAKLWAIPASGRAAKMDWSGTMAIGKDGTLYVPGNDGVLYAFQ